MERMLGLKPGKIKELWGTHFQRISRKIPQLSSKSHSFVFVHCFFFLFNSSHNFFHSSCIFIVSFFFSIQATNSISHVSFLTYFVFQSIITNTKMLFSLHFVFHINSFSKFLNELTIKPPHLSSKPFPKTIPQLFKNFQIRVIMDFQASRLVMS